MVETPIRGLETFLAVAEHGSLRAAAAALGVQPPAVSLQLKALEEQIGVSVFARTTRSVKLTDAGRQLLRRARPAMAEIGEALEEARGIGKATKGTIRVTVAFAAFQLSLVKRLAAFREAYPDVELEFSFNEGFVDIVSEGFHAGVRMGHLVHDTMVAVRLTPPQKEIYFASPAYLDRHGRPREPRDLLQHNCIRYRYIGSKQFAEWQFQGPDGIYAVDVSGNLIVDSTTAQIEAAKQGLGLCWLFEGNIIDELASGALESVLDEHAVERPGFFLYFPRESTRLTVFRLFVDYLKTGSTIG